MNEIPEIERFLGLLPEFAMLSGEERHAAARATSVAYYRTGTDILEIGKANDELQVVRSGAVELRNEDGDLVTRLAEGDCFGFPSLMNRASVSAHSVWGVVVTPWLKVVSNVTAPP